MQPGISTVTFMPLVENENIDKTNKNVIVCLLILSPLIRR
jgi:hypothetical protein